MADIFILNKYQCQQIVRAAKITEITYCHYSHQTKADKIILTVITALHEYEDVQQVSVDWVDKYRPREVDYYIVDDKDNSYCIPRDLFETNYEIIKE